MYFVSATDPTRSLRTNNHTLPSHLRLCFLFVASYDSQGLRWRYSLERKNATGAFDRLHNTLKPKRAWKSPLCLLACLLLRVVSRLSAATFTCLGVPFRLDSWAPVSTQAWSCSWGLSSASRRALMGKVATDEPEAIWRGKQKNQTFHWLSHPGSHNQHTLC
jgi:hypothetical protein